MVCCVRCTARYPSSTSAAAPLPLRANAAGNSWTMATDSMTPAPNATSSSMTRSSRTARRVTASAPSTLPAAATRAYNNALDTREQVFPGIASGVVEHFFQQPCERLAHIGTGPDAGGDEIVAFHREVLQAERRGCGPDCGHGGQEPERGNGDGREQ